MPPTIIRTTRTRTGGIFIPPSIFNPAFKAEIVLTDSTTLTVTNDVLSLTVDKGVGELAGAEIVLNNDGGTYSGRITGGETLKIYMDYSAGTTLFFTGKIDEPYFGLNTSKGWHSEIYARQVPELADKTVFAGFTSVAADTAVKNIIDNNFSGLVTYAALPTGLPTVTIDLRHETGIGAIRSILELAGYVCYIDANNALQAFVRGSQNNTVHQAAVGINLEGVNGLGKNIKDIKNRVYVYGGGVDGSTDVFYLATKEDTSSQSSFWVKDLVINDTSIQSTAEAESRAQAELTHLSSTTYEGSVSVFGGLLEANPGQNIRCHIPYCNIDGFYEMRRITHSLDTLGLRGQCYLSKEKPRIADLINEAKLEAVEKRAFQNPNQMKNAFVATFDDGSSFASTTGVSFTESRAKLLTGSTTGTATTATLTVASYRYVERRAVGEQLGGITVAVSRDGVTFTDVPDGVLVDLGTDSKQFIVRVTLTSNATYPQPEIDSLGVFRK